MHFTILPRYLYLETCSIFLSLKYTLSSTDAVTKTIPYHLAKSPKRPLERYKFSIHAKFLPEAHKNLLHVMLTQLLMHGTMLWWRLYVFSITQRIPLNVIMCSSLCKLQTVTYVEIFAKHACIQNKTAHQFYAVVRFIQLMTNNNISKAICIMQSLIMMANVVAVD